MHLSLYAIRRARAKMGRYFCTNPKETKLGDHRHVQRGFVFTTDHFIDKNFNCPVGWFSTSIRTSLCIPLRFIMKIIVNGEEQTYSAPLTVTTLLQRLDLRTEHVAVEINLTILDRSNFPTWNLEEGDKIEILSFIGGGSPHTRH